LQPPATRARRRRTVRWSFVNPYGSRSGPRSAGVPVDEEMKLMISTKSRRKAEPARRVQIDALRMDVRARVALSGEAVAEYAEAMNARVRFPPIVVFEDGETLWLADGHHRVEAARRVGRKQVRAEVHAGGRREALLHACGANAKHGVRGTNVDKRRAVTLMLRDEELRQWSNREVARRCAVDEGLVRSVRKQLSADDPRIAPAERRVRRGATVYSQRAVRRAKLTPDQVRAIRADDRSLRQIAHEYGVHKSQVSRTKNNKTHIDPDLPALPNGLRELYRAWNAASPDARVQFLCWLWSEHPEMIGAVITEPQASDFANLARVNERHSAV
jgi:ParB-like chromosome segregation protein Spo0J